MRAREVRSGYGRLNAFWLMTAVFAAVVLRESAAGDAGDAANPAIGARGHVGCGPDPRRVQRLSIIEPGVYENILVDGRWTDGTLVKTGHRASSLRSRSNGSSTGFGAPWIAPRAPREPAGRGAGGARE